MIFTTHNFYSTQFLHHTIFTPHNFYSTQFLLHTIFTPHKFYPTQIPLQLLLHKMFTHTIFTPHDVSSHNFYSTQILLHKFLPPLVNFIAIVPTRRSAGLFNILELKAPMTLSTVWFYRNPLNFIVIFFASRSADLFSTCADLLRWCVGPLIW